MDKCRQRQQQQERPTARTKFGRLVAGAAGEFCLVLMFVPLAWSSTLLVRAMGDVLPQTDSHPALNDQGGDGAGGEE